MDRSTFYHSRSSEPRGLGSIVFFGIEDEVSAKVAPRSREQLGPSLRCLYLRHARAWAHQAVAQKKSIVRWLELEVSTGPRHSCRVIGSGGDKNVATEDCS